MTTYREQVREAKARSLAMFILGSFIVVIGFNLFQEIMTTKLEMSKMQ